MKIYITGLAIVFALFLSQNLFAQTPDAIKGKWYSGDKEAQIEIFQEGNEYYGKIVWLKEPTENGKPIVDQNNPDKSKRNQPIKGMKILRGFEYADGKWEDGTIYDPQSGKTYSSVMKLKDRNTLEVRGFIGISFIGRTDVWTRAED